MDNTQDNSIFKIIVFFTVIILKIEFIRIRLFEQSYRVQLDFTIQTRRKRYFENS